MSYSSFYEINAVLGWALVLALPWTVFLWSWLSIRGFGRLLLLGQVFSITVNIGLGMILAAFQRLDLFLVVWFVLGSLTLVVARLRDRRVDIQETQEETAALKGHALPFCLLLLVLFVSEALPTFLTNRPPGWDPAFHALIARKVLLAGGLVKDWLPFENIDLNYPQGLHVWIAILAKLARTDVHIAFLALQLYVQVLACLLVYLLGEKIFKDVGLAIFAMGSYGLLAKFGSFYSYFQWGGLATGLGMLLFLVLIFSLLSEGPRFLTLGALCLGTCAMVHHLSALMIAWVLVFYCVLSLCTKEDRPVAIRAVKIVFLSGILYAPFLLPYALNILSIGDTHALRFVEERFTPIWSVVQKLGPVFCLAAVAGLVAFLKGAPTKEGRFLLVWVVALVFGFAIRR